MKYNTSRLYDNFIKLKDVIITRDIHFISEQEILLQPQCRIQIPNYYPISCDTADTGEDNICTNTLGK